MEDLPELLLRDRTKNKEITGHTEKDCDFKMKISYSPLERNEDNFKEYIWKNLPPISVFLYFLLWSMFFLISDLNIGFSISKSSLGTPPNAWKLVD